MNQQLQLPNIKTRSIRQMIKNLEERKPSPYAAGILEAIEPEDLADFRPEDEYLFFYEKDRGFAIDLFKGWHDKEEHKGILQLMIEYIKSLEGALIDLQQEHCDGHCGNGQHVSICQNASKVLDS